VPTATSMEDTAAAGSMRAAIRQLTTALAAEALENAALGEEALVAKAGKQAAELDADAQSNAWIDILWPLLPDMTLGALGSVQVGDLIARCNGRSSPDAEG
jgi:regulator of protease activity HflC (stomatin/prohibitin superfamily)